MAERKMNKFPRTIYNEPGDEIVITGISGIYPNALNLHELEHKLYNKIDMIDDDERRWRHENVEIPKRYGKIYNLDKFDATFFGVHSKQAHAMDPQSRILIEKSYEAFLDAGINPKTLRGTRTGVFIGSSNNEAEKTHSHQDRVIDGFGMIGFSRAMLANRISYTFGLQGPSFAIDTACSSSLYALDEAFTAMRNGECDAALVGAGNLLLHPNLTWHFARLGVLASDGVSRPFDAEASGYVRSEAISILFLQKSRDAKRIYSTVEYSKTNNEGYKDKEIHYPSGIMQAKLLSDFYNEINILPETIDYVEAHSSGIVVSDSEECKAIDEVLCKNRKTPLPIGSVKSNLGHADAAAGMCSIAKCILAMENQLIPPTINVSKIHPGIKSLVENRLQLVQHPQKLEGPLIAINSFGIGGANAHCLLRSNLKEKINKGAPKDSIPRLVPWSGRTENACNTILEDLASRPLDVEHIALLHNSQSESVSGNVFKSYGLYKQVKDNNSQCILKEIQHFSGRKRPIVFVFSGMGSQWNEMGTDLMNLPIFHQVIQKCHDLLKPKGLDLLNIITSPDKTVFDNILHSFVGIASIQAALCDCLAAINIQPDYIIGHSVGEVGCAYADKSLTMEQMILCAYYRGMASLETKTIKGSMAAIGLSYYKIKNLVPPTIDIACHNGPDSCTISGPQNDVNKFVAKLTADGIFAREVPCSNIPFHSRYIVDMGPKLLEYLLKIIKEPKKRSEKWLSTSVPKNKWDLTESQFCSAQYQTNNLLSSVLFEETSSLLPHNAVVIEIAPHGLLQAILRKSLTNAIYIPLTQRGNKQCLEFFFAALGKIYLNGIDIAIENLYPKIEFPVSRGTPKISHLIKWDYTDDWFYKKSETNTNKSGERKIIISLQDEGFDYISGHIVDGHCLFPATGYLGLVWETFAKMTGRLFSEVNVQFDDVKYLRATTVLVQTTVEFFVMVQIGTGRFEIIEGNVAVVTGYIKELSSDEIKFSNLPPLTKNDYPYLTTDDFYKELRIRGYHYNGLFRNVIEARADGLHGKVRWNYNNWVTFLDSLVQTLMFGKDTRSIFLPTTIEKLTINATQHQEFLNTFDSDKPDKNFFEFFVNKNMQVCQAGGIEIKGLQSNSIGRRRILCNPVLESYKFIPYLPTPKMTKINSARICIQHALENHPTSIVKCIELLKKNELPYITKLMEAIEDLPLTTSDLMILTSEKIECENIHVEDSTITSQSNCLFIIKSNCLIELEFFEHSKQCLLDHGYIISREAVNLEASQISIPPGFNLIASIPIDNETLVLLQKKVYKLPKQPNPIKITLEDKQFKWIEQLKTGVKQGACIVYSQNESLSGILGLVNCIRKELIGSDVTSVFVDDPKAPPFNTENLFYKKQLDLNFAINIYRNGQWGTYRHLKIDRLVRKGMFDKHTYANLTRTGDLSSIRWLNGTFSKRFADNQTKIQFAALNFRDIILATDKLSVEVVGKSRLDQECVLGLEYSGIDSKRNKIMGMAVSGAIGSHIVSDPGLTWICPKNWTLEQAATVPVVYGTVYAALFIHAEIKKGTSILIHAGTDSVGLAAIRVALAYGLNVFTTVSTKEKREFLLQTFTELKDSHIGSSRNLSFENMIQIQTNGAGVDYVLNSLAEEKLQASVRCLGKGGKFLEIGKFDMANNNKIGLREFLKEISFHAVLVDNLLKAPLEEKMILKMMLQKDIDAGIIKPLPATVYPASEIEDAFKYLASTKQIGKVLIQIREDPYKDVTLPIPVYSRINCKDHLSYVIVGGLGGFGLELIDWLIMRGARKIVISSTRGVSEAYQAYRIKIWESYGAIIKIKTSNIGTQDGCETILKEAIKMGPISGIFNLAVDQQDAILENQTIEKFKKCFIGKVNATIYLDQLSRKLCPALTYFVVFSSISCGRGNAGQTNYGMANSIMERIIEQRYLLNLPGKAIQWGAFGEVGLVPETKEDTISMKIGGILPQRISSCLEELDNLLLEDSAVVASMIVAEKRTTRNSDDVISKIMHIMSITGIKSISTDTTLVKLGMDSLMAVEIKHIIEHDLDIILSTQDLRTLTFTKLYELKEQTKQFNVEKAKLRYTTEGVTGFQMMFQSLGNETSYDKSIIRLTNRNNSTKFRTALIIVPGIEGIVSSHWTTIVSTINLPTFFVQLTNISHVQTINKIVEAIINDIHEEIGKYIDTFYIIGYSFGSLIALHLANKFEESGIKGTVVLIDGSLSFMKKLLLFQLTDATENTIEDVLCTTVINAIFPEENPNALQEKMGLISTWKERISMLLQFANSQSIYSKEYIKKMLEGLYNRMKMILYSTNFDIPKIKSSITLIRPRDVTIQDIDEDYELGKFTEGKIFLKYIEGNHLTMLENPMLIALLNELQPKLESDNNS